MPTISVQLAAIAGATFTSPVIGTLFLGDASADITLTGTSGQVDGATLLQAEIPVGPNALALRINTGINTDALGSTESYRAVANVSWYLPDMNVGLPSGTLYLCNNPQYTPTAAALPSRFVWSMDFAGYPSPVFGNGNVQMGVLMYSNLQLPVPDTYLVSMRAADTSLQVAAATSINFGGATTAQGFTLPDNTNVNIQLLNTGVFQNKPANILLKGQVITSDPATGQSFAAHNMTSTFDAFFAYVEFNNPLCVCGETLVDTPSGPVRLDNLKPGDYVISSEGKPVRVIELVECWLKIPSIPEYHDALIIEAHALGPNQPSAQLKIDPGHPIARPKEELRPAGSYRPNPLISMRPWIPQKERRYDLIIEGTNFMAQGLVIQSRVSRDDPGYMHRYDGSN